MRGSTMKFTVGKKLYAGFITVLVMLGLVGSIGIGKLSSMNDNVTYIVTDPLPGVEGINNINYLTEHVLATDLKIIVEPDQAQIARLTQDAEKTFADIDKALTHYESTITTDEDRKNFNLLKETWEQFKPYHNQFVEMGKEMDLVKGAGDQGQQVINLIRESEKTFNNMQKYVDALLKINHDNALKGSQQAAAGYQSGRNLSLTVIGIALLVSVLIAFTLTRSVSIPVRKVYHALERMSEGDLRIEEIQVKNRDEIGDMAHSFNKMAINIRQLLRNVSINAEQVAATSEELSASAEETSKATEQISISIQEVAIGSEKQVSHASEATQAVTEISKGMNEAAMAIQSIADLTTTTNEKATIGTKVVSETMEQMNMVQQKVGSTAQVVNNLGKKSMEIGQIVEIITQIANQTNLLALNAAIEAARAGEHGRGFAVVADEVRKLAEQSGKSAGEIRELIGHIQLEANKAVESMNEGTSSVNQGIQKVHETGTTFKEIVHMIREVSEQSQEVSAIIEEVNASSQNMVEMMEGVAHISEQSAGNTQHVAAAAEEQNASMEEISASAEALSRMALELQEAVSKFKV
jgi:methyl-accepting chemotaxis protein